MCVEMFVQQCCPGIVDPDSDTMPNKLDIMRGTVYLPVLTIMLITFLF